MIVQWFNWPNRQPPQVTCPSGSWVTLSEDGEALTLIQGGPKPLPLVRGCWADKNDFLDWVMERLRALADQPGSAYLYGLVVDAGPVGVGPANPSGYCACLGLAASPATLTIGPEPLEPHVGDLACLNESGLDPLRTGV